MGNFRSQIKAGETIGVGKLIFSLEQIQSQTERLTREIIVGFCRQLLNEIPYAFWVIRTSLADSLLTDAPQSRTDLTLNTSISNLGQALFNPAIKDDLASLVKNYLRDRKNTEREYASTIAAIILGEIDFSVFPERSHAALRDLAQSIIENVINEKQSRKTHRYQPQALFSLIEPVVHNRLYNLELDKIKVTHYLLFRKFVNMVAQEAYSQVNDHNILNKIQLEKNTAFNTFNEALANSVPSLSDLENFQKRLGFLQLDIQHLQASLKIKLDEFLTVKNPKTNLGILSLQLRGRFSEKLRRALHNADQDISIYQHEATIKQAHQEAYHEILNDVTALQKLITQTLLIQSNYSRNLLRMFYGKQYLAMIEIALLDVLLGQVILKTDLDTAETRAVREGGYPQKNITELYAQMASSLIKIGESVKGVFSDKLKAEIFRVTDWLQHSSKDLKIMTRLSTDKMPLAPSSIPANQLKTEIIKPKPVLKVVPPAPVAEPLPPVEPIAPSTPEPKFEAKPLIIEEVTTPETPEPKPLIVEETAEIKEPEPKPLILEEVSATPLEINEPEVLDQATLAAVETGTRIMSNYRLGDFEPIVLQAWKAMITSESEVTEGMESGLIIPSDNEVRLYVICDLMQQIAVIPIAQLTSEQKQRLEEVKSQLINALKNPMDDINWDYFEGNQRDEIDRLLASLV